MKLPRPKAILWFERLYFASLGIALFNEYVMWPVMVAEMEWTLSSHLVLWFFIILFSFIIWYFLAIKAKAWARWMQIIFTGLAVIVLFAEIGGIIAPGIEDSNLSGVVWKDMVWPETFTGLYVISVLVNGVGTAFLFRSDAVQWFEQKRLVIDKVFD